jgi:ABC-type lipoprotein export system ATPase subunit
VLSLLLEAVDEHGKTLVVITHDPAVAARMDRVYEIRDKQLHERK